jgi:general secretion pathway protein J
MRDGFSLVEMLVALLIFALLTTAGVAVLRFSIDNREIVHARSERLAQFQRTRAILKADLAQAADRRVRAENGQVVRGALFGGGEGGEAPILRLVRRGWDNPDAAPRASLQAVEYRVTDGRLERLAAAALDGAPAGSRQVLIDGVRQAHIRFLWQGQWVDILPGGPMDPLPQAVQIALTLDGIGAVKQLFVVTGEAP